MKKMNLQDKTMYEVFADLHIHIGRSEKGHPTKITAAKSLNFANIAKECSNRKGIQIARNN
ncbi:MAG: endonuclease Q family protein [Oscillospiraceae bacterium]|nr:endonuclease Q family protein [Oscillospiraceae bacterium]